MDTGANSKSLKGDNMTREEELKLMAEFIEKNGVTKLPRDARIDLNAGLISAWGTSKKSKKRRSKKSIKKA